MALCIRVADRHNVAYGTGDFSECMVRASLRNEQVRQEARGELVLAKARGQTGLFERHVTMHCIVPGGRFALAVLRMPAPGEEANFMRKTVDSARRAGARIGAVMLNRVFFVAKAISS